MNVVQNYLVTMMHSDFSLYETRIFSRIVLLANNALQGHKASAYLGKAISIDGINCNMRIKIADIITPGSHDYEYVYQAAKNLSNKVIEFYDRTKKKYVAHYDHLITNVSYVEGSGEICFTVSVWLLEYILDFVNGHFSIYDFQLSLSLPSAYAVRLYWLTCSMTSPVDYSIKMLRDMLGVGDKYAQNRDFIKRCIERPRQILEEHKMNGFTFRRVGGRALKAIYRFYPVKRQEPNQSQLVAQASLSAWCTPAVRNYLKTSAGFSNEELAANKNALFMFCHIPDCNDRIVNIVHRQRAKGAGKGYIINAIKNTVQNAKREGKIEI